MLKTASIAVPGMESDTNQFFFIKNNLPRVLS